MYRRPGRHHCEGYKARGMVLVTEEIEEVLALATISPVCRVKRWKTRREGLAVKEPQPYSIIKPYFADPCLPATPRQSATAGSQLFQPNVQTTVPTAQQPTFACSQLWNMKAQPMTTTKAMKANFGIFRRLHSVLGPGGTLMSDDRYEEKFGLVSAGRPFGGDVYRGMIEEYKTKYCAVAKKAWHLERCSKFVGTFKPPRNFSKLNAKTQYDELEDSFEVRYPAMFFLDPRTGTLWMVCLKMVIGCMVSWEVHPTRAGPADPTLGTDPDWHMLADN